MTIEIQNLTKTISGVNILDNINLTMNPGVIIGLSGINGSGKTMLMRMISGLIKPTKGVIYIDGKRLWQDISFPESLGILIENPAFIDTYSGVQNLKMIASVKGNIVEEQVRDMIEKVGLDPNDKKKYRKYSLGMKQRLGIAAALMESPDIILLDEPTNALDSSGVELIKMLINKEKARGAYVVISCHDSAIMQELADEIYFMESGKVTKRGSAQKSQVVTG